MIEKIADAMMIPMCAFLHIFIKEVCIMERKSSSSPNAAKPAIMNKFNIRPPMLVTLTNLSIISVARSCISCSNLSKSVIESGNFMLAFHSANTELRGKIAYIIATPKNSHVIVVLLNPSALKGFSFMSKAYTMGGSTKVNI